MRLPLASLALSSVLLFAGCAAEDESSSSDDVEASEDEVTLRGVFSRRPLTNVTVVEGALREGDTLTVPYKPAPYVHGEAKAEEKVVPYLAIELTDSAAPAELKVQTAKDEVAGSLAVSLEGDFPSSPQLIVTDANFRVLARAKNVISDVVDSASVNVPSKLGKKFVLVRDPQWDKPMTFNLALNR